MTERQRPEWRHQAEVVSALRKRRAAGWPIEIAASLEAGRRTKAERGLAKVTGMVAGEPDLRVYLPGGRLALIEMKIPGGRLSGAQRVRHAQLAALGHPVKIIAAASPEEAAAEAVTHIATLLGDRT